MQLIQRWPARALLLSVAAAACRAAAGAVFSTGLWAMSAPAAAADAVEWPDLPATWARVTDGEAWRAGHWRALASPYTLHWRPSPEHRHVVALGMEWQAMDHWLAGGSLFRNSFGQPSAYVYLGHRSDGVLQSPRLFFQWSAGLLYGYRGKYESKVPLNLHGFAPGAVVSLGWQFDRQLSLTAHALGDAGVMVQLGYDWR